MYRISLVFSIILVIFCCNNLFAQFPAEAFALTGNGARAAGMGYAFTGIADDATAISWNSAGLTQLQSMEASVIGRINFGSGSIDFPSDEYAILYFYESSNVDYGLGLMDVNSWDVERGSNFIINFASFIIPFSIGKNNIVGGIAYRNLYDFSSEVTGTISGELFEWNFYDDSFWTYGDQEYKKFRSWDGGVNAISPSLGLQINQIISVGATVNILMGSAEFETYQEALDDKFDEEKGNIKFSGTSVDIGVLIKPIETLSIGANFSLPYSITGKTEWDDSDETEEGDLEVPLFFSVGAGFRATDNLLLAFDYRSRPWSKSKIEDNEEWKLEDANSIHAGLEYLIMAGKSVLPVRLGFYTHPLPAKDASDEQIVNNVFTGGLGVIIGNLILDSSFEWEHSSYASSKTSEDKNIMYTANDFKVSIGAVIHLGE